MLCFLEDAKDKPDQINALTTDNPESMFKNACLLLYKSLETLHRAVLNVNFFDPGMRWTLFA